MTDLHDQILSIPLPDALGRFSDDEMAVYREGMRDCRHAAAELAAQHESDSLALARAEITALQGEIVALREALEGLVSNEEHATSGGMRDYQKGSPTWELWEAARASLSPSVKAVQL